MTDARRGDLRDLVRDSDRLPVETWDDPVRGSLSFRTLFSREETATDALTTGVAELEPHGRLEVHWHSAAEVYFLLEGRGLVTLGDHEQEVGPGWSVFIPGGVRHGMRNVGSGPLRCFYALAADGMEDVVYHFEGSAEGVDAVRP